MAHTRVRHLIETLQKRRKLWPIVGVLGARQVGKSTLLKDQLTKHDNATYLESLTEASKFVVIDEVQKVPDLFDALKANVDARRRPGQFIISGSTEFSEKSGIRESLTGRIGLLRLFPLTLAEANRRPLCAPFVTETFKPDSSVDEVERWLNYGGMPSHCFLRSQDEREASWNAWIDTVCFRDLAQFKKLRLDGDLAKDILEVIPSIERPSASHITERLHVDTRKIKRHIEALAGLFLLQKIRPHPAGVGKDEYILWDTGFSHIAGASLLTRLRTLCVNECLAQFEYSSKGLPKLYFFQSSKGTRCDLIVEQRGHTAAFILSDQATLSPYISRSVGSIQKHIPKASVYIIAPVHETYKEYGAVIVPWTAIG